MNHKCYKCGHKWRTKDIPAVDLPGCPECGNAGLKVIHSVGVA